GMYGMGVAMERGQFEAGLGVPEPDALVLADRGQLRTVGAEGDLDDTPPMTRDRPDKDAGGQVPEVDGVVLAAADQLPTIGREGHAADPLGVSGQWLGGEARFVIPDLDAFEAGQGEAAPIAVIVEGVDRANRLAQVPHRRAVGDAIEPGVTGTIRLALTAE